MRAGRTPLPRRPRIDDIAEPTLSGPLDVVVKVGAPAAAPTCTSSRASGPRCRTDLPYVIGHENAGWCTRSATASRTWRWATP